MRPHQLEVPQQMTMPQGGNHSTSEHPLQTLVMMPSAPPSTQVVKIDPSLAELTFSCVQNLQVEPKLSYTSLPVSQTPQQQQQVFYPGVPPPPPPPQTHTQAAPPPPPPPPPPPLELPNLQQGTVPRSVRGKQRTGSQQRGIGKRVKPLGLMEQRPPLRSNQGARGKRGQPVNRRVSQRKLQNIKNKNFQASKKQKQLSTTMDETQDFNFMGYMAQLADELEEQEAFEEGEIRE